MSLVDNLKMKIPITKERAQELVCFGLVGAAVMLLGLGLLHFLMDVLYWSPGAAKALELPLSLWLSLTLNEVFTCKRSNLTQKGFAVMTLRVATMLFSGIVFVAIVTLGFPVWLAQVVSVGLGFGLNYAGWKRWATKPRDLVRQTLPLDEYRLTRYYAIMIGGTFVLSVIGLWLIAHDLFVTMLLVAASLVASLIGGLFLISLLYSQRHGTSSRELRPRPLQGECRNNFANLMPARHEVSVLPKTIMDAVITQLDHTSSRFFPIICDDDPNTIRAALAAAKVVHGWSVEGLRNVDPAWLHLRMRKLLDKCSFDKSPLTEGELADIDSFVAADSLVQIIVFPLEGKPSKPKQMNYAYTVLRERLGWDESNTRYNIIDSEGGVRPGLLTHVDQKFTDTGADIVQGGVQLMPTEYSGSLRQRLVTFYHEWFSWLNVLEYHRWFPNQLPFQSRMNFVPLGGNTVFMSAELLRKTGGWMETLTEDAATGVVATAVHNAKVAVFYAPELTTREKTPPTVQAWRKQRTRWDQGFLRAFLDGHWRALPTFRQRALAVWILTSPFFQAFSALLLPVSLVTMFTLKSPVLYVLLMCVPVALMVVATMLQMRQLYEFGKVYDVRVGLSAYLIVLIGQVPYQIMLSYAALWAVYREIKGITNWDKTERPEDAAHKGANRILVSASSNGS